MQGNCLGQLADVNYVPISTTLTNELSTNSDLIRLLETGLKHFCVLVF